MATPDAPRRAHLENDYNAERYYAHSGGHLLSEHLKGTARLAAKFAEVFCSGAEAEIIGLLHDAGKYRKEFQEYLAGLRNSSSETHHSAYGATYAGRKEWWASAFAIAGHHAGLHDRDDLQNLVCNTQYASGLSHLKEIFTKEIGDLPAEVRPPAFVKPDQPLSYEFYVRMLFSCLVDADYLDTEEALRDRRRQPGRLPDIVDDLINRLNKEKEGKSRDGLVNQIRHTVFEQCVTRAELPQGFFSLTVPTGGGKTLSGMAFALAHAKKLGLRRVIVVIPYLSIIEQNAAEYRRILDPGDKGIVVEHHSAVPVRERTEDEPPSSAELAAENWDAPIIVTTSVQFIESLFARSPSKCRKLHNIAKSVVVMDEVQTLPTRLLRPLLSVFRELKENYGTSFLFMTATQPAFCHHISVLPEGFTTGEVLEITNETQQIFATLRRVKYRREGTLDWRTVAKRMAEHKQALCVVNVRKHAFELWEALRDAVGKDKVDCVFHLSSAMCPEHRLSVMGKIDDPGVGSIRYRLKNGLSCQLVSTQVVEAGVDLDFPMVWRALGPLDSIVQAAGRCNREGRLPCGEVVVFAPAEPSLPGGIYAMATNHTAGFIEQHDLDSIGTKPDIFGQYFSQLFQLAPTDYERKHECTIQEDREWFRFKDVAHKAKVIDEDGMPVVVQYEQGKKVVEEIRARNRVPGQSRFTHNDLRKLQRYMVNVRDNDFGQLLYYKMVVPLLPNLEIYVLEEGYYHKEALGLLIKDRPVEDLCDV